MPSEVIAVIFALLQSECILANLAQHWAIASVARHGEYRPTGGKAKQSSLQVRDYKFCGTCEERFNKGGEAWILNKISQNYGDPFWLHTLLNSKSPTVNGNDLLFSQASIPEVDMAKLVYFALSIFWRGTRRWSAVEGGQPPKLYLGRQEKAIRAFLLARGKLLEDVVVTVAVWPSILWR